MKILITGGAGFIGSAVTRQALAMGHQVVVLDALTYAANPAALQAHKDTPDFTFEQADICDGAALTRIFETHRPHGVMHLAAESHVDRSISGPAAFMQTNIIGTYELLEASRRHWVQMGRPETFRFHHVSTDEVFGTLGPTGQFDEDTPYAPNSPYSASKAASDHLVRAWGQTYGLPTVLSNCSNNYGPFQFPEKLVPVVILNAIAGRDIPVYGAGEQIRDWLHVEDHARALLSVLMNGRAGRSYAIGANCEQRNIDMVHKLCRVLDHLRPAAKPYSDQISFVSDRLGHDARYAIDASRIRTELGWRPQVSLAQGLHQTVSWYLDHADTWVSDATQQIGRAA